MPTYPEKTIRSSEPTAGTEDIDELLQCFGTKHRARNIGLDYLTLQPLGRRLGRLQELDLIRDMMRRRLPNIAPALVETLITQSLDTTTVMLWLKEEHCTNETQRGELLGLATYQDFHDAEFRDVKILCTIPGVRQGFGSAIVDWLKFDALNNGLAYINLYAGQDALWFFLKQGFRPEYHSQNQRQVDMLMTKFENCRLLTYDLLHDPLMISHPVIQNARYRARSLNEGTKILLYSEPRRSKRLKADFVPATIVKRDGLRILVRSGNQSARDAEWFPTISARIAHDEAAAKHLQQRRDVASKEEIARRDAISALNNTGDLDALSKQMAGPLLACRRFTPLEEVTLRMQPLSSREAAQRLQPQFHQIKAEPSSHESRTLEVEEVLARFPTAPLSRPQVDVPEEGATLQCLPERQIADHCDLAGAQTPPTPLHEDSPNRWLKEQQLKGVPDPLELQRALIAMDEERRKRKEDDVQRVHEGGMNMVSLRSPQTVTKKQQGRRRASTSSTTAPASEPIARAVPHSSATGSSGARQLPIDMAEIRKVPVSTPVALIRCMRVGKRAVDSSDAASPKRRRSVDRETSPAEQADQSCTESTQIGGAQRGSLKELFYTSTAARGRTIPSSWQL